MKEHKFSKELEQLVLNQLNIKKLTFKNIEFDLNIKPNYREMGKEFGHETADIIELINSSQEKIKKKLDSNKIKLGKFELRREHFNIEKIPPEGFAFAESKIASVLLNLEVSEDL